MDVSKLTDQCNQFLSAVDGVLCKYDLIKTVQEKGVRPAYLFIGMCAFATLFLFYGVGAGPLCNLVGFIYPVFASFKALKTDDNHQDERQWLTYWIVYAFFCLVEDITDMLSEYIPLYHLCKLSFLVWCFLPQTCGATTIFEYCIKPLFNKYEGSIDKVASEFVNTAKELKSEVFRAASGVAKKSE